MLVMEIQPREPGRCPAPNPRALLASPARADPAAVTAQGKRDTTQRFVATGDSAHLQTPTALRCLRRRSPLWRRGWAPIWSPPAPVCKAAAWARGPWATKALWAPSPARNGIRKPPTVPRLHRPAVPALPPAALAHTGPGSVLGAAGTPWGSPRPTSTHRPRCRHQRLSPCSCSSQR